MHRLAPAAGFDLDDIWVYVAKESGSFEIADKIVDAITERFWLISSHPHIGRGRDEDLRSGLRSFAVGKMSSSTGSKARTFSSFGFYAVAWT